MAEFSAYPSLSDQARRWWPLGEKESDVRLVCVSCCCRCGALLAPTVCSSERTRSMRCGKEMRSRLFVNARVCACASLFACMCV